VDNSEQNTSTQQNSPIHSIENSQNTAQNQDQFDQNNSLQISPTDSERRPNTGRTDEEDPDELGELELQLHPSPENSPDHQKNSPNGENNIDGMSGIDTPNRVQTPPVNDQNPLENGLEYENTQRTETETEIMEETERDDEGMPPFRRTQDGDEIVLEEMGL
jgi:hypothetical protein